MRKLGPGFTRTATVLTGGLAMVVLAASPALADTSQATASALQISLLGGGLASSGTATATNDGTTESISGNTNPPLSVLGSQTVITAGVLGQDVRALNDGTSAACAGVLGSGGSINVGSGGSCTATPGAGATLTLGVNGLATITLVADALYAQCSATSSPSATGSASLANARIVSTTLGVPTTLLTLPANPAPNTGLSIPGLLSLVLNSQTSSTTGQLSVTALDLSALGGTLAGVTIGSASCGPNAIAPPVPVIPLAGTPIAVGLGAVAAGAGGILMHRRRRAVTRS
ncbi:choice-of-anchor P family protein [Micromonospora sp. HUAS LYJ1]|uniref:choice-of-anchor P family protein n=1 Tax=Micromonospora sp. HUAS LYJ1 TaxID=3061626 RepID=UPI00267173B0|nr:choice-of-anchor P family protein [Micromonospora sp. HUAS LYJ1]WKU03372.1 choice-of-anchor P family protein [Micromonospora sp. HUAS LYJ1]